MKRIDSVLKAIKQMQYTLGEAENNAQYIRRLKGLKHLLHSFDSLLDVGMRLEGKYATEFAQYLFTGRGFSLLEKVEHSIAAFEYGDKPFTY